MAFGREDTDKVYDDLIAPTLRNKGATPVRVDRIEHIDDIDDRIISEIEACDFALADLTYARPSVYFEAGFAQRKVPVIYTCRKDHLSPRADDPFGNFRVHFDLQMKNIIPWSSPSDYKFAERLGKRITRVVAPLLRAKKAEQVERKEAEKFAALSLQERTQRILDICVSRLHDIGYRGTRAEYEALCQWVGISPQRGYPHDEYHNLRKVVVRALQLKPGWIGTKSARGVIHAALIHVTPGFTKSKLITFREGLLRYPVYNINPAAKTYSANQMSEYIFVCSFRKVPPSRILDTLHDFRLDQESKVFVWVGKQAMPKGKIPRHAEIYVGEGWPELIVRNPRASDPKDREIHYSLHGNQYHRSYNKPPIGVRRVPRHVHICVLDTIRSEKAFATEFSDLIKRVETEFV